MINQAVVFYNTKNKFDESDINNFNPDYFTHVVSIEACSLEDVYSKMNVVYGDELPITLKVRSLSIGDVVRWLDVWYVCSRVGWVACKFDFARRMNEKLALSNNIK